MKCIGIRWKIKANRQINNLVSLDSFKTCQLSFCKKSKKVFFLMMEIQRSIFFSNKASKRKSLNPHQSQHQQKKYSWGDFLKLIDEFLGQACWNQRSKTWNNFYVCVTKHWEKNVYKYILVVNFQLGKGQQSPQHVQAAPLLGGPSIRRFDVGWKIRTPPPPPQQTEGWNTETETQKERLEREEPSTDGLCCD